MATAAPGVTSGNLVQAERSNYYDIGVQQKVTDQITVGLDSYYKQSHNLIDEGQFEHMSLLYSSTSLPMRR